MKCSLNRSERAEIYGTAWRVYCSTQSSYYAYSRAASVGDRLRVAPYLTDDVARAAVEKVRELQREFAESLIKQADERSEAYCATFLNTTED